MLCSYKEITRRMLLGLDKKPQSIWKNFKRVFFNLITIIILYMILNVVLTKFLLYMHVYTDQWTKEIHLRGFEWSLLECLMWKKKYIRKFISVPRFLAPLALQWWQISTKRSRANTRDPLFPPTLLFSLSLVIFCICSAI